MEESDIPENTALEKPTSSIWDDNEFTRTSNL